MKDVGSNSTEYTTNTGLRAYKNYHVSIQAFTVIGAGPWSTPTTILTSEDAPTAPTALTVVPSSSTSLNITWEAPATPNGIIRSYKITYHIKDESTKKTKEHTDVSSLATTLSNLTKWTTYVVTVEAETIERGPPSSTVEARTNEDVPSGAPKLNSVTNGTEGMIQLLLNWEAPTVPNGILTKYEIEYGISMSGEMKNETKDNSTMIVIDNLNAYTHYYIRIRGYTKVGPGPYMAWAVFRTDQAAADPPENFTITELTHNSANLRWNVPSITNGEITNYEVRIFTSIPEQDTVPVNAQNTTDKDTLNMLVENLLPCTLYYFKVAAYNTKNRGVSAVTHGTTSVNVPGPPLNVTSEATSSTSMTVTWEKPPNETCPINYTVHVYEYAQATSQYQEIVKRRLIKIGYNTVSSTIVNLKKYWEYRFEVTASTSKDSATSSRSIPLRTLEDTPTAPRTLTVVPSSSTSLNITWEAPATPNGIIRSYKITYHIKDQSNKQVKNHTDVNNPVAILSGLEKGTSYVVSVAAQTIHLGPVSLPIEAHTYEDEPDDAPFIIKIVKCKQLKSTGYIALLEWQSLKSPNGIIIATEAKSISHDGTLYKNLSYSTQSSGVLRNLVKDTLYNVQLRAYTSKGHSPWSIQVPLVEYANSDSLKDQALCTNENTTEDTQTDMPSNQIAGLAAGISVGVLSVIIGTIVIIAVTYTRKVACFHPNTEQDERYMDLEVTKPRVETVYQELSQARNYNDSNRAYEEVSF